MQSINPFTAFMSGGQFGPVNINLGQSSEPAVEAEALSDVARYGKQPGLIVLLAHFPPRTPLNAEALKEMLAKIADVKEKHSRPALRPRAGKPVP